MAARRAEATAGPLSVAATSTAGTLAALRPSTRAAARAGLAPVTNRLLRIGSCPPSFRVPPAARTEAPAAALPAPSRGGTAAATTATPGGRGLALGARTLMGRRDPLVGSLEGPVRHLLRRPVGPPAHQQAPTATANDRVATSSAADAPPTPTTTTAVTTSRATTPASPATTTSVASPTGTAGIIAAKAAGIAVSDEAIAPPPSTSTSATATTSNTDVAVRDGNTSEAAGKAATEGEMSPTSSAAVAAAATAIAITDAVADSAQPARSFATGLAAAGVPPPPIPEGSLVYRARVQSLLSGAAMATGQLDPAQGSGAEVAAQLIRKGSAATTSKGRAGCCMARYARMAQRMQACDGCTKTVQWPSFS